MPEGQIEDQVVQQGGHQRDGAEPRQHEVDLHRVDDGIEVRRLVAVLVYGADGLFDDGDRRVVRGDEHLQLVLVAGRFDAQDAQQQAGGDAAQAGLRVRQLLADQGMHHHAGEGVAKAAAPRHVAIEGAASENQAVRARQQSVGDAHDVVRMVLAVGVRGDDSHQSREGAQRVIDAGLQSGAFAQIGSVPDQVNIGECRGAGEHVPVFRPAAIVHNHDGGYGLCRERADQVRQGCGWLIRRDQNCKSR